MSSANVVKHCRLIYRFSHNKAVHLNVLLKGSSHTNYVSCSSTMLTKVECTNCGRPTKQGLKCSFCGRSVAKASKPVKGAENFTEPKEPKKQPKPAAKKGDEKEKGKEKGK